MAAQEGGQRGWPLLLGGAAIGAAAAVVAYTAATYLRLDEPAGRSHRGSRRSNGRAARHGHGRSRQVTGDASADDEADSSDDRSLPEPPLRRANGYANGTAAASGSAHASADYETPQRQHAAWNRVSDPLKDRRVRLPTTDEAATNRSHFPAPSFANIRRDPPSAAVEGSDSARQVHNAPQPKFYAGPAHRNSFMAVQEVMQHESPYQSRQELERNAAAAAAHAKAGAGHGPVVAPASIGPAPPGHAPQPNHHLSTAPDLITEGRMLEDAALHEQYTRVITPEPALNEETEDVCSLLKECYDLRDKWLFRSAVGFPADEPEVVNPSDLFSRDPFEWDAGDPQTQPLEYDFEMVHGVTRVWTDKSRTTVLADTPGSSYEFFVDMHRMLAVQAMGAVRTFCFHRLLLLEQKFNLHNMMNADKEFLAQKSAPHRDFYNVRKVDTHIHHSACMHQKHLLRFIKSKLRKEPDQVVIFRDGKYLTLAEVFESLQMTGHDLNVDTLDMHADKNIFHRFDKFNLKYNPCGQSRLREIFIKQDNIIHGRFLAELTKEVISDLEGSKYQHAELRISIYGRKRVEWDILAAWICQHHLYSDNVVWLIQIPRLYAVYKEQGIIETFEQMLDNIFTPLFEVTCDPNTHPQLHLFLKQVVGFDMVDDESKPERRPNKHMQLPDAWNLKHNPAYSYYAFYTYANLYTLNKLREARGLNTFSFRPHAGEAGDVDHLASAFMLCENIAHGINLRKSPCLQYLFYLKQIGLCMSPLSNNSLFLDYHRNPLPTFFARGLNVSLSTDDPLQIHLTREPLVEEYSVASQVWKLSATDLCEIARNSVLHSGFPHQVKMHWVHRQYWKHGPEGNDIQKTNVPNLRMRFRGDTFLEELGIVMAGAAANASRQGARSS